MSCTFISLYDWSRNVFIVIVVDMLRFHVSKMPFLNKIIVFKAIVLKKTGIFDTLFLVEETVKV